MNIDIQKIMAEMEIRIATVSCSRSTAYSIKRKIEKITAPDDKFVEMHYDKNHEFATFEFVT